MNQQADKHEIILNELYAELDPDVVFRDFLYLTNPGRIKKCSWKTLKNYILLNKVGTLIRRIDPVTFNCGIKEAVYEKAQFYQSGIC